MNLRPLTSLDRDAYFKTAVPPCGAEDSPGVVCQEPVIGHMWPSDWSMLKHIQAIKDSRGQKFPRITNNFVCEKHSLVYTSALNWVTSPPKVTNGTQTRH